MWLAEGAFTEHGGFAQKIKKSRWYRKKKRKKKRSSNLVKASARRNMVEKFIAKVDLKVFRGCGFISTVRFFRF